MLPVTPYRTYASSLHTTPKVFRHATQTWMLHTPLRYTLTVAFRPSQTYNRYHIKSLDVPRKSFFTRPWPSRLKLAPRGRGRDLHVRLYTARVLSQVAALRYHSSTTPPSDAPGFHVRPGVREVVCS